MADILKNASYMPLPSGFKRGNPISLDTSEVWYSYAEMKQYAENHPTAYVGQILALVDEANNNSTAYIILNKAGELKQIGSAVFNVDNKTLTLSDDTLGLKDFGVKYYARVESADGIATYQLQVVDAAHPWKEGLEPRVVLEDSKMVLGWFEPNTDTIEGVSNQITIVQTAITTLEETKVSKEEGKSLVDDKEIVKLSTIKENAEPNIISSVNEEEFTIDNLKKLLLKNVDSSKIKNLSSHQTIVDLRAGVDENASLIEQLNTIVANNTKNIQSNTTKINNVADQLNNYVLKATYEARMTTVELDIEELKDRLTWKKV